VKKKAKCVKQKSEDEDSVFGKGTINTKKYREKCSWFLLNTNNIIYYFQSPLLNILANWEASPTLWVYCSSKVFVTHFIKAMTFAREYSTGKTLLPGLGWYKKLRGLFWLVGFSWENKTLTRTSLSSPCNTHDPREVVIVSCNWNKRTNIVHPGY
jgi:hypothetical protein